MDRATLSAASLAVLLATSAVSHRVRPEFFYSVVPRSLCRDGNVSHQKDSRIAIMTRDQWIYVSGVLELAAAIGLLIPRTRPTAAVATAAMFSSFAAGHVSGLQRALGSRGSRAQKLISAARLPLQVPLILWAWSLRR